MSLRTAWRTKVEGVALAALALTLLGVAALLREGQERAVTRGAYLRLTAALVLLLLGARALMALAIPHAWLLRLNGSAVERLLLRSPADFAASALVLLVLVGTRRGFDRTVASHNAANRIHRVAGSGRILGRPAICGDPDRCAAGLARAGAGGGGS